MKRLLFIFAIFPAMLLGQNPGHQIDRVQNQFGQGVPNPSVRVCTEPAVGSPCSNLATIYTCNAINGSCIGPNPLTGDQYGNYNFFAPNNVPYHLEFTGPSLIVPTILYYVYLAGIGGGGGGAVPCGVLYDVQINDPLGTFGCDTGVFTENPTTHTVSDTIVVATQQLQTGSSGITGTLLFNHSNGSSINASLILGLDSTFSTSYGLDFPDTAALGALTVTSLTPGTDGRLPTAWVPSSGGGGSPCGGVFDVQINNPLGDFGCDPGIFQENPATHTVTDTIVQATQQIQVSDPTHTGVINFGSSNGTSIVSNFLLGLSPTFSTTSGGYGVDVPDSPAIGTLAISSLTPGSDGRLPTVWSTAPISAISCENVPTLQGCNANYPATTSDIQYTLYPASDDYVFKAPPNSSYGSSAVVQDCLMTNLGSPSQNSCACTHTYSGTTVTISCTLPHVFPGDSIVAFGAIICGLGCNQYPQFTDSQSNIYTQLDPEGTGPSGGGSVDGITVGVAGNYSDTVTATFLSINSEYYSSLHVIELRGVTRITAHGGAGSSSGPATFPGVTTTGEQAILGFSFDNTYGAPGCSYSAGTGYQMYNQDAIANGSFGDEGIIETANGTYTPTINRNSGCLVAGGTAQTVALAYTGSTTGSDILWPQRLRFSTLVVGGDFDPLATGTGLFSPDGQRVSALTFGSGLTLSGSTLEATGSGGTVTSVSGTANQIDVATGTTTPVISLDSAITFPGTITMGANAADFSSATSFKPPGGGGTFTVGTANINWATLGTGVVLNTTTTGAKAVIAAVGTKCYPYQGSSGTGCDTPSGTGAPYPSGTGIPRVVSGTSWGTTAELSGDATTSGSNAVTVVKANGGTFPASAFAMGTNSSRQPTSVSATGGASKIVSSAGLAGSAGTALCDDGSGNATESGCSSGGLTNVVMPADLYASSITSGVETVTKQNQSASYFLKAPPANNTLPFLTHASSTTCTYTGTPPFTCTLDQPTSGTGHALIVVADYDDGNCSTLLATATDSASNTYTANQCSVDGGQTIMDLYFLNVAAGVTSVTVAVPTSPTEQMTITVLEVPNIATSSPIDQSAIGAGPCSGGFYTNGSITTVNAVDFVLSVATSRAGSYGPWSATSPFTLALTLTDPGSNFSSGVAYFVTPTTNTFVPVMGCPGGYSIGFTTSYKALAGAPSDAPIYQPAFPQDFYIAGIGSTVNHSGLLQTQTPHSVADSCTLGTSCAVTLTGTAIFSSSTSYSCVAQDSTATNATAISYSSGSAFTITGTGTDVIRYICTGD